jgi:hypothetical protein
MNSNERKGWVGFWMFCGIMVSLFFGLIFYSVANKIPFYPPGWQPIASPIATERLNFSVWASSDDQSAKTQSINYELTADASGEIYISGIVSQMKTIEIAVRKVSADGFIASSNVRRDYEFFIGVPNDSQMWIRKYSGTWNKPTEQVKCTFPHILFPEDYTCYHVLANIAHIKPPKAFSPTNHMTVYAWQ